MNRARLLLLKLFVTREFAARPASAIAARIGIALAIAVVATSLTLNTSITTSLDVTSTLATGRANLEVRPVGAVDMPADVVNAIRSIPGVALAEPLSESYVQLRNGSRTRSVLMLGVQSGLADLAPPSLVKQLQDQNPLALALRASAAKRLHVRAGDEIEIATPRGWFRVSVGGLLSDASSLIELGMLPLGTFQRQIGRPGRVTVIYVKAERERIVRDRIERLLGPRVRVGPLAIRRADLRELNKPISAALAIGAATAVFLQVTLTYTLLNVRALRRRREAAIARAVGASRKFVVLTVIAQGAALGLMGLAVGLSVGILLPHTISGLARLQTLLPYGIPAIEVRAQDIVVAGAIGIASAFLVSIPLGMRHARIPITSVLGEQSAFEVVPAARPSIPIAKTAAGVALLTTGALLSIRTSGNSSSLAVLLACVMVFLTGFALTAHGAIFAITRWLMRRRLSAFGKIPGTVRLAWLELGRSPGRIATIVAGLLVSLSLVLGFVVALDSFTANLQTGLEDVLQGDFFVRPATWRPFGSDVALAKDVTRTIETVPGVDRVIPFRLVTTSLSGTLVAIASVDFGDLSRATRASKSIRRVAARIGRALDAHGSVAASPAFARRFRIATGGTFTLPLLDGDRVLRVAAIFPDPIALIPTLYLSPSSFRTLFGPIGDDRLQVFVRPEAQSQVVQAAAARKLSNRFAVVVESRRDFVDRLAGIARTVRWMIQMELLATAILAALGLVNVLMQTVIERRRELTILWAVGTRKRELRRMQTWQALTLALIAGLGACIAGTGIGVLLIQAISVRIKVAIPVRMSLLPYFVAVGSVCLAAIVSARLSTAFLDRDPTAALRHS